MYGLRRCTVREDAESSRLVALKVREMINPKPPLSPFFCGLVVAAPPRPDPSMAYLLLAPEFSSRVI